jgi:hypothetical protein
MVRINARQNQQRGMPYSHAELSSLNSALSSPARGSANSSSISAVSIHPTGPKFPALTDCDNSSTAVTRQGIGSSERQFRTSAAAGLSPSRPARPGDPFSPAALPAAFSRPPARILSSATRRQHRPDRPRCGSFPHRRQRGYTGPCLFPIPALRPAHSCISARAQRLHCRRFTGNDPGRPAPAPGAAPAPGHREVGRRAYLACFCARALMTIRDVAALA